MNNTALNNINDKLKELPDNYEKDILDYLSFLNFKSKENDWVSELSKEDLLLIKKGQSDIQNARIYTHEDAMKRIDKYIQDKRG